MGEDVILLVYDPHSGLWFQVLRVGGGECVGEDTILSYKDAALPAFTTCNVGTVRGNTASWTFVIDDVTDDGKSSQR